MSGIRLDELFFFCDCHFLPIRIVDSALINFVKQHPFPLTLAPRGMALSIIKHSPDFSQLSALLSFFSFLCLPSFAFIPFSPKLLDK